MTGFSGERRVRIAKWLLVTLACALYKQGYLFL